MHNRASLGGSDHLGVHLALKKKAVSTVPAPVLKLEYRHHTWSSHACAIVQVAVSRERCGKRASKPNGKNLYPS